MVRKRKKRIPAPFRVLTGICFMVYLLLLIKLIVFKNPLEHSPLAAGTWSWDSVRAHLETANFIPGHTIRLYLRHWERLGQIAFANLVYNVVAFIPFGIAVPVLLDRRHSFWFTAVSGILFSVAIELTQLITLLGECDIDDVILNGAGAVLGWLFFIAGKELWHRLS